MEKLEAGEYRIRSILDAAVDAIITIDATDTIESFNRSAETMFGFEATGIIGENISKLMASPYRDQYNGFIDRYAKSETGDVADRLHQFQARRKNGTEFPIQLSISEIRNLGLFILVIRDVTEQRELQKEIVRIATGEQQRIGEDLHDSLIQELTGLGLLAQTLADTLTDPELAEARKNATRIAAGIAEANRQARSLAEGLIPVPVDADGLMTALENLANHNENLHGVPISFVCPEPVKISDDGVAMHMYRIAQEAVTNAIRHAQASQISIHLEHDDGIVRLQIRDNGRGIRASNGNPGLGIRIMEHRCELIGGTFSVKRLAPGGTIAVCTLPMSGNA